MSEKISSETNAINWFEIAVKDIARAKKFYEIILETELTEMEMMGMKMAMLPSDSSNGKVGGALVQSEMHTPSATGSIVYLNGNPDIQLVLNRIEKSGGKITMPKTLIDEQSGYMAFFTDTEGNNIGLHSNN
ncbi:MAG: VOC family protein [Sporocytophaga sp.]|uniref:VOC family protein n=1 Tax=Sporocytophaga sp. TaxID=2231183 RepID=UPI001B0B81AD|nr:VOC family protein [Sporocytophaga sp.]MBO9702973.1 VOC family protein [Sporocytophaga sp.]